MSTRQTQASKRHKIIAPSGGVESGDFILVGTSLVHVLADAAAGEEALVQLEGAVDGVPADGTAAFTDLAPLYWNGDDGNLVNGPDVGTGTGHPFVGLAFGAKAASATTCSIKLVPSE